MAYWNPDDPLGSGTWDEDAPNFNPLLHWINAGNIGQDYFILDADHMPIALGTVTAVHPPNRVDLIIANAAGLWSAFDPNGMQVDQAGTSVHYQMGAPFSIWPEYLAHADTCQSMVLYEPAQLDSTPAQLDLTPSVLALRHGHRTRHF